MAHTCNF